MMPATNNATNGGTNGVTFELPWTNTQTFQTQGTDMVMSNTITKISAALLKAQAKMGAAVKDSKNPFFRSSYADLNSIREASHPSLNDAGITVLQPIVQKDGKSFVRTLLLHESGEYLGSDTEVVTAKQNDPQAYGSAISYARRYGLQAFISLGAEDDDGEKAMSRTKTSPLVKATTGTGGTPVTDTFTTTTGTTDLKTDTKVEAKKTSSFRKPKANGTATEKGSDQPTGDSDWQ